MLAKECMTNSVTLIDADSSIAEAARKMKDGDFGAIPVQENERLVGMITDRDIAVRAVALSKDPQKTKVRDVMSKGILYCFENDDIEDVAFSMGDNQVRRFPVLSYTKRIVGILSLGDMAITKGAEKETEEALCKISKHQHNEYKGKVRAPETQASI